MWWVQNFLAYFHQGFSLKSLFCFEWIGWVQNKHFYSWLLFLKRRYIQKFFDWFFNLFPVIKVLDWNSVIKFWLVYSSGPLVWLTGLDQSPTGIFAWERKKEGKKSNNYLSFRLFVPSNFHLLPNKRHLLYPVNVPNFTVHTKFVGTPWEQSNYTY